MTLHRMINLLEEYMRRQYVEKRVHNFSFYNAKNDLKVADDDNKLLLDAFIFLKEEGFINIFWADNVVYLALLTSKAKILFEKTQNELDTSHLQ